MITRPREDASGLAEALAGLGIETVIEPLLFIETLDTDAPVLTGVQALLVTSANGVRAFSALSDERDVAVYAVGDASARAAREAGFSSVTSASGDVDTLADLVAEKLNPEDGALLHVAGTKVAGDLAGRLEKAGFTYQRARLYHAAKAENLSGEGIQSIRDGNLDGVVLYSPRTAESFVELLEKAELGDSTHVMTVFCLSQAVAEKVGKLTWGQVVIAETPDQVAMIESVRKNALM